MKLLLTILSATVIISSCTGGWSDAQRKQFVKECADAAAAGMGQEQANSYCSCMVQKLEAKYPNYTDAAKALQAANALQTPEMQAMVQGCLNGTNAGNAGTKNNGLGGIFGDGNKGGNENLGGTGRWSKNDEDQWMNMCATDPNNRALCACVLQKLEAQFASYDEMNQKGTQELGQQLAQQCQQEMGNGGAMNKGGGITGGGGAWSNADEQSFLNTCQTNATNAGADRQTANAHCSCVLKKIEAKYRTLNEANQKMTSQEVNAIEQQCLQERTGGNQGGGFDGYGNDDDDGD